MPTIYLNDGLRIAMNNRERGHKIPHVHVYYKGEDSSFTFDGEQLNGKRLPRKIEREVQFYLQNHQEFLEAMWRGDY